jgi:SAM-dependent MidA family methyltransferase
LGEGQIAELSPDAESFIARAAQLIERGFVITVDYGDERAAMLADPYRQRGTLRVAYHHQIGSDVLLQPGRRDLTTTIDWTQLREAGERVGLHSIRHEQLDQFLLSEGIIEELERLTSGLAPAEAAALRAGAREMILPTGMAASFQVLIQHKQP